MRRSDPRSLALLAACLASGVSGRELDLAHRDALLDPEIDHVGLVRFADRHLVLTMLAPALAPLFGQGRLPADFQRYLEIMHGRNLARNLALRQELLRSAALLNRIGIEPVLIKGAARLVDGVYPGLGWRFMRDLDILVPPQRLQEVNAYLQAHGLRPTRTDEHWPDEHRHLPPLYREGDAAVLEVHGEPLHHASTFCPTDRFLLQARPLAVEGAVVRLPAAADQIALLIGHDRFDDYQRRSGLFQLRSLFELALLGREAGALDMVHAQSADTTLARYTMSRHALAARLFPTMVAASPPIGFAVDVWQQALLGLERLDGDGRMRRLVGFSRTRAAKLLRSTEERQHLVMNVLSPAYHRRGFRRLQRLWTSR
jgi:hypothetical protein